MHTYMCEHIQTTPRVNSHMHAHASHTHIHAHVYPAHPKTLSCRPLSVFPTWAPPPPNPLQLFPVQGGAQSTAFPSALCVWPAPPPLLLGFKGRPPLRPFPDSCSPGRRPGHILTQAPGICVPRVLAYWWPPPRESPKSALADLGTGPCMALQVCTGTCSPVHLGPS